MKTGRAMIISFVVAIACGLALLMLLQGLAGGGPGISFIDALFTATSAVCVTGLVVRDTGADFHFASQLIILLLIQLGGLGILTFSNLYFSLRRHKIGLRGRVELETAHGMLGDVRPRALLLRIVKYTLLFESVGALVLTLRFARDYSWPEAAWHGVFHSVSAFCNAGFDLFGTSLTAYRDDVVVNVVMVALITAGGLGFIVLSDLSHYVQERLRRKRPRLFLHTRAVLVTSGILLAFGLVVFSLLEFHGQSLRGDSWAAVHSALFLSVTARTAGFNTLATVELTNPTLLLLMLLMLVGGSPGSTAGGMKTTTLAALYASVRSRVRNLPRTELLGRSLSEETVSKAIFTLLGYFVFMILGVIALQFFEAGGMPHTQERGVLLDHMFEVISALATVGLSTGVTAGLSAASKVTVTVLMLVGRLGPLLVAMSLVGSARHRRYTLPEENINIG